MITRICKGAEKSEELLRITGGTGAKGTKIDKICLIDKGSVIPVGRSGTRLAIDTTDRLEMIPGRGMPSRIFIWHIFPDVKGCRSTHRAESCSALMDVHSES